MPKWVLADNGFKDAEPNPNVDYANIRLFAAENGGIRIKMDANNMAMSFWFSVNDAEMVADYLKGVIAAQRLLP